VIHEAPFSANSWGNYRSGVVDGGLEATL